MSPSAPKPAKRKQKPRFAHRRDAKYAAWVRRSQACLLLGSVIVDCPHWDAYVHVCIGATQAAHVQSRGAGGNDRANLIPLCLGAHHEQHSIGTKSFEARWGVDLKAEAEALWIRYLKEQERQGI